MVLKCMLLISCKLSAQAGNLCQFMVSPVQFNPAFAGVYPATFRLTALYKTQWASEITPYELKGGSFETVFSGDYGKGFNGMALTWFSDRAGSTRTGNNHMNLIYARTFQWEHHLFSAGLLLGLGQQLTDQDELTWDSQYDGKGFNPAAGSAENIMSARPFLNAGMGVAYTYDRPESYMRANNQLRIRTGVSVNYLNRPNRSLINGYSSRLLPSWMVTGDFLIPLRNSKWMYRPVYLLQWVQREFYCSVGLLMGYRFRDESVYTGRLPLFNLFYGLLYRADQGPSLQINAEFGRLEFGFGYDIPVSALGRYTGLRGATEFSIRYLIRFRNSGPLRQN